MKKVLKRFIVMLLTLAMPLSGTALAESSETEDAAYVVEGKTYPYLLQFSDEEKNPAEYEMTLYFVNGGEKSPMWRFRSIFRF